MDTLTITYVGQCGFLLDFGDVRIVTDPYFGGSLDGPWARLYPPPTTLAELRPDAILISHSHGDHMDLKTLGEYYAAGGDAFVAAPAPECAPLRAFAADYVIPARSESAFAVGRARVTPIPCAHTAFHLDDQGRFHELSYIVECGDFRVFFGGDMSLYDGLAERIAAAECDVLLLPVNGRDEERTSKGIIGNTTHEEAARLSARLGVPYIAAHHDLFAINGCPPDEIYRAANEAGAKVTILKLLETLTIEK